MNGRPWLRKIELLLLTGLIQSASIAGVGVAADFIAPVTLTVLRTAIASFAFAGLLALSRPGFRWRRRAAADIAILGLLNVALPFLSLAIAVAFISTSLAAALSQMAPVFTVILASLLLPGERLNAARAVGTIIAVAGAAILLLAGTGIQPLSRQAPIGEGIIILGALSVASGLVYARARVRDVDTLVLAAGQMFAALAAIAPLALILEGPAAFAAYSLPAWGAILVAALGTPVAGYWLVYYILKRYGASLSSFAGIATPFFSEIIGIVFLGEVFALPMVLGALLLISGLLVLSRSY